MEVGLVLAREERLCEVGSPGKLNWMRPVSIWLDRARLSQPANQPASKQASKPFDGQ